MRFGLDNSCATCEGADIAHLVVRHVWIGAGSVPQIALGIIGGVVQRIPDALLDRLVGPPCAVVFAARVVLAFLGWPKLVISRASLWR